MFRFLLITAALVSCAEAPGRSDAGLTTDARIRADATPLDDAQGRPDAPRGIVDAGPPVDANLPPDAEPASPATLVISEIVDATLSNGLPKFVEITNTGPSSVELGEFSLGLFNNGGTSLLAGRSTVLVGTLAAGDSHVISFDSTDVAGNSTFFDVYGFDADDLRFSGQINGNDVVALFRADGSGAEGAATGDGTDATLVDLYGVIGVDGVGEVWEYTDGFVTRRLASTSPTTTFDSNDWGFSGPGALIGLDAQGIAAASSPGSH